MLARVLAVGLLQSAALFAQSNCLPFPAGLVPFSSTFYVTAANSAGDQLVVGQLANGLNSLIGIPTPSGTNQLFCDQSIALAPQQLFSNVYVPTPAERTGNFSAFAGLLVDPATRVPFPGGIIPTSQLTSIFAFRIAPVQIQPTSRQWSATGPMSTTRVLHSAVLLANGKVLIVGGTLSPSTTAELYDPATGVFTLTGPMQTARSSPLSTALLNDGRVLVASGNAGPTGAELYDPATGKFSSTGATTAEHVASSTTLLADGRVLLAGGTSNGSVLTQAEVFDPRTGTFTAVGALRAPRAFHTATLLPDGRVLLAGGIAVFPNSVPQSSTEVFDPATGQFTPGRNLQTARAFHAAVTLANGTVLLAGGNAPGGGSAAEIFNPTTGAFTSTGDLAFARTYLTGSLLTNGQVLVTGGLATGLGLNGPTSTAELFVPSIGKFSPTGSMLTARRQHTATVLPDGRVLVTGGTDGQNALSSAEIYAPLTQGLVTSQTGLVFRGAPGAIVLPAQNVVVLSATDTIPYNVSVKTFTGGNWLRAAPPSATISPGTFSTLTISADLTGLTTADYYGQVTLTPTDGKHPPVSIAIVLTIVPSGAVAAPSVFPTGLVFLGAANSSPKAQAFTIVNVTSKPLTFTAAATQSTAFFTVTPGNGAIAAGQSQSIAVTPTASTLAAGVYRGSIKLMFGDGSSQTVDVLLVLSPAAGTTPERDAGGCTATKLLPVLNSIGAGFTAPVAWPTPIVVQVVDDCGVAVNTGAVTASFTNGDAPLALVNIGSGLWSATWVPVRNSPAATVRADAQSLLPPLAGTVQVTGQAAANPKVPVVAAGDVISAGDYIGSPAQGLLAAIFGSALADGTLNNSGAPLPVQLGSTSVSISGVQIPIVFVSDAQVNVLIPYELAASAPHQLIVQRANAISVPVPITVFDNQPGVLATAGNGKGQGHVYVIDASQTQTLADAKAPAKAGDVLTIYAVGLGPVNPKIKSGDAAPFDRLETVTGTASLTIGGVPAQVVFAGLTPGFSGLYQINAVMPAGVAPGSQVPVVIAVNGRASAGAVVMAAQ